ncbi:unnamed protein product [Gongylonema pulchrum]|uniref:Collagen triple helix repeat protein n=1 Tax=Gongylonema pulchrum TaxID=637853 RepID=A0A183EJE8_9BILA|nr:unnamed protein product [Gongylonema pulchrum]
MLKCDESGAVHARIRRQVKWSSKPAPRQQRFLRAPPPVPQRTYDDFDQWTVVLGQDTIIPKIIFDKSCKRIHRYCTETGRKMMGFQGPRGPVGPQGIAGPPGRCNCSFPDLYVQQVTVPGPPVIRIHEKPVPVPVVVVKEIEVTKLVTFEPTAPGFGPPPDWIPGVGTPDLARTQILPKFTTAKIEPVVVSTVPALSEAGQLIETS